MSDSWFHQEDQWGSAFNNFGNNSNLDYNGINNDGFGNFVQNASPGMLKTYGNWNDTKQQSWIDKANKNYGSGSTGLGWNTGTLQGVGSVLKGVGSLAGAWAGMKGVKLGEKELAALTEQWNKNYESQAITVNNRLRDQNAWKGAQGRTDMATLVPKYGNIG